MIRFGLALVGHAAAQGAPELRRTEIGRSGVSGTADKEVVVQLVALPPGATSGRHFHNGEEIFSALEGGMTQMPGRESQERSSGSRGINQREVAHAG